MILFLEHPLVDFNKAKIQFIISKGEEESTKQHGMLFSDRLNLKGNLKNI